jgi:hypothetical protein
VNLALQSNLSLFNSALARYIAAHQGRKSVDEIMEKKGRALGVQLFLGFKSRKWGGPGKRPAGLARQELDARVANGEGIRVRRSIMQDYLKARSELRGKQRGKELTGARIEQRTRLWRSFVGRELGARQRGIGVLAAAFLWYRRRSSQARGVYYVKNRTGKFSLGRVERDESTFRIVGDVQGLSEVDARYGIVERAIASETADIQRYFESRPEFWQFWNTFSATGGVAA